MTSKIKQLWTTYKWRALKYFLLVFAFLTHYGTYHEFFGAFLNTFGILGTMLVGELAFAEKSKE